MAVKLLKVKPVSIRERDELEPIIVANPDAVEEGLQIIARQHPTDSGPLDILAVDSEGALVVIELKNEASEEHLDQGLRYYDWCRSNLPWIAHAYRAKFSVNPANAPRLILVAPSFTQTVTRIAKYVDIDLQLVEYRSFQARSGERGIICTEIDFGQPPEPPEIPTMAKKVEYFRDEGVKGLFMSALEELEQRGVEARPIRGLWISFWYKGKRFMSMSPKRHFFVVNVLAPGGDWLPRQRVKTRRAWEALLEEQISAHLEYLDESGR